VGAFFLSSPNRAVGQRAAAALGDVAAKIGELAQTFDRYLDAQLRELDRSVAETSVLSQVRAARRAMHACWLSSLTQRRRSVADGACLQQFAIMYETVAREAINDLQPAASGQLRAKTTKGSTWPPPPGRRRRAWGHVEGIAHGS